MLSADGILMAVFWDDQFVRWIVWSGLVVLTVALLVLARTRWGQSQPLGKCVVLSLVAHLLLGIYLTTVNIVTSSTIGSPDGHGIQVAIVDGVSGDPSGTSHTAPEMLEDLPNEGPGEAFDTPTAPTPTAAPAEVPAAAEPERMTPVVEAPSAATKPTAPAVSEDAGPPTLSNATERPIARIMAPVEMPSMEPVKEPNPVPPPEIDNRPESPRAEPGARPTSPDAGGAGGTSPKGTAGSPSATTPSDGGAATKSTTNSASGALEGGGTAKSPAKGLEQRLGDHLQVARGRGATQESEAAVIAALRWLATGQSNNGRWEARRFGGGGMAADAEYRDAAGAHADTGITGLVLLAFLAGGNTHMQGSHQPTVRRGLEFLLNSQDADGCLASTANQFERMYCHAMATCALSEAFAMTGDRRLENTLRRALQFTVRTQDRTTGGWRYQPFTPGDTSQLGWQVMSLKSAELAGISIPLQTRDGIARFLGSVKGGRGGLARYQPSRPPTRSMTAEALVCRQFLGLPDTPDTLGEAGTFVLQEMPGASVTNHYYWYYGTLAMYQLQGDRWTRWNEALQKKLLTTQRADGDLAGSWDPDAVWGSAGGRAYSTALATLSLEVYYRFLPLHVEAAGVPAKPQR